MWRQCLHQLRAKFRGTESVDKRTTVDFVTAIGPLVIVSKILGLGPYALSVSQDSRRAYVISKSAFVYSILWLAGMLSGLYFSVPIIFRDRPQKMAPIMETTSTLQAVCGILVFVFSHLICLFNRHRILKLVSMTAAVGESLGLSSRLYSTIRRVIIAQIIVYFIFQIVNGSLLSFGFNVALSSDKLVTFFLICVAEMSSTTAELQFVNLVLMLNLLYKAFCQKLDAIPKKSNERGVCTYIPVKELDEESTGHDATSNEETDCFGGLDLSEVHCKLHDISQAVGSLFGLQNLLIIVYDFCSLLYGLYFVSDTLLGLSRPEDNTAKWLAYVVFEAVFRSLRLGVMVASCSTVTSQANELAYTVSKLQTSARDAKRRSQMQTFSSQLVHRKINFTASGFLPIDASLISAIVGGVTTYLVIIIQFQMMTPPTVTSSTSQPISDNT